MMDDFFMRFVRRACQLVSRKKKRHAVPGDKWELPIAKISNMLGLHVSA